MARFRKLIFVVLQSSCPELFLLWCFSVRSRLGPSPVQNMALSNQCSDRRRSDLGRRLPKLPKRRLCRGLESSTRGVGPNLSRSRVSRNLKTNISSKLKSAQSSQARDPKRKIGKVSQTLSRTRSSHVAWVFDPKVSDEEHLQNHRGSKVVLCPLRFYTASEAFRIVFFARRPFVDCTGREPWQVGPRV